MPVLPFFDRAPYQKNMGKTAVISTLSSSVNEAVASIRPVNNSNEGTPSDSKRICLIGKDERCSGCKTCIRFWI